MAKFVLRTYLSYSQLCVFLSSLTQPFNYWSDRNYSQGFSWRNGSASFKTLEEDGDHQINLFINEPVPDLSPNVIRAFKVPFETQDGKIEIASISDSTPLEIPSGVYALQVEFLAVEDGMLPEVNVRLNKGVTDFFVLRADDEIEVDGELDLKAVPAT
ncbi:MAG: competence protein ComJ [Gammaproteobacteria bacterium]|jgi:hypothetical protein